VSRSSMSNRTERQVETSPIGDVAAGFLKKTENTKTEKPKNSKNKKAFFGENVDREKTSFSLSVNAKFKVATLKADLRRRGHRATESLIVEALIEKANSDEVLDWLNAAGVKRAPRRAS
jgi:hypothetical protein